MITAIRFNGVGISATGSMLTGGVAAFPRNGVGFVHKLERNLARLGTSLGAQRRVAVGVENYRLHKGEKNPTTPKMALSKPWKKRGEFAASVLDYELKCNATVTLVIHSDGVLEIDELQNALQTVIPAMRFANGAIFVRENFVKLVPGSDGPALAEALKAVRSSRSQFLCSRDDLITAGEEFDAFVNALALFDDTPLAAPETEGIVEQAPSSEAEEPTRQRKWRRGEQATGWIVALERGYQAVTPPTVGRPAARDSTIPTIVATPVVGLGEFISAKRFLSDFDKKAFWHAWSDRQAGFYLFNASSFND